MGAFGLHPPGRSRPLSAGAVRHARVSRDESSLLLVDEWGVAQEDDVAGPWLRWSDRETGEVSIKEYFAAARQDELVELHYKEVGATLAKLLEASQARRVVVRPA